MYFVLILLSALYQFSPFSNFQLSDTNNKTILVSPFTTMGISILILARLTEDKSKIRQPSPAQRTNVPVQETDSVQAVSIEQHGSESLLRVLLYHTLQYTLIYRNRL